MEVDEGAAWVRTDELFGEKDNNTGDSGGDRKVRIHVKERAIIDRR